ncbi:hypothetical protein JXA85_02790, partial [Candidatus Woesearchaeota archaeon]|nr:hypothetical protein [Candidatus Woesearchaeota archaeon]
GKTPKKLEIKMVSEEELNADLAKAKAEREKAEVERAKQSGATEEKKEKKPETIKLKDYQVPFNKAINFNNGQTATSVQELIDILNSMSPAIYRGHCNENKNDVADWMEKIIEKKEIADEIRATKSRTEAIAVLDKHKEDKIKIKPEESSPEEPKQGSGGESAAVAQEAVRRQVVEKAPAPAGIEAKDIAKIFEDDEAKAEYLIKQDKIDEAKNVYKEMETLYKQLPADEKTKVVGRCKAIFRLLKMSKMEIFEEDEKKAEELIAEKNIDEAKEVYKEMEMMYKGLPKPEKGKVLNRCLTILKKLQTGKV